VHELAGYLSLIPSWPKVLAGQDGSNTIVCRISWKTTPVPRPTEGPNGAGGHSLGGVVALMLAAGSRQVKKLILEDPTITLENYRKIIESSRDMFGIWLELKKRAESEHELGLLLAEEFKGYPGVTSSWLLFFARCLWQLDPTFFNAMLRDFGDFAAGYNGNSWRRSPARCACAANPGWAPC
jgi:pimeloyl-ACP methyl ester carboxylesterase